MKIETEFRSVVSIKSDLVVAGIFEDEKFIGIEKKIDELLDGEISSMIKTGEFKPEFKATRVIHTVDYPIKNILLIGLGKRQRFNLEKLRQASGVSVKMCRSLLVKSYYTTLHTVNINVPLNRKVQAVAEASIMADYRIDRYKTDKKDNAIEALYILDNKKNQDDINNGMKTGLLIGLTVNHIRDLVNTPAIIATPAKMAEECMIIAKENNLKISVFSREDMEKMGMGCILGVSRGSIQEPKFVVMEYSGGKETIALVGKGITYDSGGLSLKTPSTNMQNMYEDKAGACAVLGVMNLAVKLKLPLHVVGIMPFTENMPSGSAIKPGDILTAFNKKTIEVVNTDAEGRLILADALSYAEKTFSPKAIIDIATLTGACVIALGYEAAGVVGDDKLYTKLRDAGEKTGERVWQLPLWDEYKELVKGDVTDIINSSKTSLLGPGTITGGCFLSNFIEKTPWIHIDIAGTSFLYSEKDYVPKNATGYGIRLLTQFLMDWKN